MECDVWRYHNGEQLKCAQMTSFFKPKCQDFCYATTRTEITFCYFVAEHNLPALLADHFTDLAREMFPDSEIAKKFKCKRTKTTQIVKRSLAKAGTSPVFEHCRKLPYSLNDKAAQTRLLDMPICSDGSAQGIFNIIDGVLSLRPASGWHPAAHASGCNSARIHRAGTTGRHPAVGSTAVGGPAFAQASYVAEEPVNIIPQPPSLNLPPPQIPSTPHTTLPPGSVQHRSRYLQPKRCQQSDYNYLVKAETAKARFHIQKLELQCKSARKERQDSRSENSPTDQETRSMSATQSRTAQPCRMVPKRLPMKPAATWHKERSDGTAFFVQCLFTFR